MCLLVRMLFSEVLRNIIFVILIIFYWICFGKIVLIIVGIENIIINFVILGFNYLIYFDIIIFVLYNFKKIVMYKIL